jgi:phospholipase C
MSEGNGLDTFNHVVVLMLENRSFDNLLGYLYSQNSGMKFDGVDGKNLSNAIPTEWQFNDAHGVPVTEVPVARIKGIDITQPAPPYPDPGEDYPHVNIQLFYNPINPIPIPAPQPVPYNHPPYNLPNPVPAPAMTGFVTDFIVNYIANEKEPAPSADQAFYDKYKYVMESYDPADVPVFSGLASEFAVFDHWFCSVPSETICNRNFWHAGTSCGHVINPGPSDDQHDDDNTLNTLSWLWDTQGATLFSQLAGSQFGFKIYSDNKVKIPVFGSTLSLPVTPLLHLGNFVSGFDGLNPDLYGSLADFQSDCANGALPAYSFIEPNFFNPHNDMHPSTPDESIDGSQGISSVYLGDALVWDVYDAIFGAASKHWKNTLLIITFDEHGGCYDHVRPPGEYGGVTVEPAGIAAPPVLGWDEKQWDGFDFKRLGLRVPTIMVSAYINKNTIVNECVSHSSFLRTMHKKWKLPSLSAREDASPYFHDSGLFSSTPRSAMPKFDKPKVLPNETEPAKGSMSPLAQAITSLVSDLWYKAFPEPVATTQVQTHEHAAAFLSHAVHMSKIKLGHADAVKEQINERDWVPLFTALGGELKKKGLLR